jgi:polyvinyl alcohol dehydrogenase (cytochrome)
MMAQLAPDDVPRLKVKWAFDYPGAVRAFAQPTIVAGRLFVGSQNGKVYSVDSDSGCTYWEFDAGRPVRSAIVIGQQAGGWTAYFGDFGANVHAVDALTGRELWKTRIDDHAAARITGSPTLTGATLLVPASSIEEGTGANPTYSCCSFRGSVVALEASTGKLQWKGYTIAQAAKPTATNSAGVEMMGLSGAAIWSSPTFDGVTCRVYVTTGDNYSDPPTDTSASCSPAGSTAIFAPTLPMTAVSFGMWTRRRSMARLMVSRPAAVRLMGPVQWWLVAHFISARDPAF